MIEVKIESPAMIRLGLLCAIEAARRQRDRDLIRKAPFAQVVKMPTRAETARRADRRAQAAELARETA